MLRIPVNRRVWKRVRDRAERYRLGTEHIAQLEVVDNWTIIYHHVDGVAADFHHAELVYDKTSNRIMLTRSDDSRARPLMQSFQYLQALLIDPALSEHARSLKQARMAV